MAKFAVGLLACLMIVGGAGLAAADEPAETSVPQDPAAAAGEPFAPSLLLFDAGVTPVTAWAPTQDGIAVGFTTGPQACFGANAAVTETPDAVIVELRTGTRPEALGRACTMNLVYGTLELHLGAPVGDREVISVG